jgi:hypothetical protein
MFFELRMYRIRDGQMERWVKLMEEQIIPFQISQGMVVIGSFVGEEEKDLYVWIRRFDSEKQREELYEKVYQSDFWKNEMAPLCQEIMIRDKTQVIRIEPTSRSVIR